MAKKRGESKLGDHVEDLPVKLTDAELLVHGQRLAQIGAELDNHYMHEDEVKKTLKANETRLEAERMQLNNIVRNKAEPKPVKVEHWADYDRGIYSEVRVDTGEVLNGRVRPLASGERQEHLLPPAEGKMLSPEAAAAEAAKVVEKKSQRRNAGKEAKEKAADAATK